MKVIYLSLIVFLVAPVQMSMGATWSVAKDGSGDFTIIQDALDAAASGDTISIGPGEYTELAPSFIPGYAWDVDVGLYVRVNELTIVGAGKEQTIIGPTTYLGDQSKFSPKALVWSMGGVLNVSGVTIRNCYEGMFVESDLINVDNCRFEDNRIGIIWRTDTSGGGIVNSEFKNNVGGGPIGFQIIGNGSNKTISGCDFKNTISDITGVGNVEIVDCSFSGPTSGHLQFTGGASGMVRNCTIRDGTYGLGVLSGAHCEVDSSDISCVAAAAVTAQGPGSTLDINSSILSGSGVAPVFMQNSYEVTIHNSHILKGSNFDHAVWVIHTLQSYPVVHDFTNNYWGTTEGDSIASWILDGVDDPATFATVTFDPFSGGPVPTEKKSLGSFKAMFR